MKELNKIRNLRMGTFEITVIVVSILCILGYCCYYEINEKKPIKYKQNIIIKEKKNEETIIV